MLFLQPASKVVAGLLSGSDDLTQLGYQAALRVVQQYRRITWPFIHWMNNDDKTEKFRRQESSSDTHFSRQLMGATKTDKKESMSRNWILPCTPISHVCKQHNTTNTIDTWEKKHGITNDTRVNDTCLVILYLWIYWLILAPTTHTQTHIYIHWEEGSHIGGLGCGRSVI